MFDYICARRLAASSGRCTLARSHLSARDGVNCPGVPLRALGIARRLAVTSGRCALAGTHLSAREGARWLGPRKSGLGTMAAKERPAASPAALKLAAGQRSLAVTCRRHPAVRWDTSVRFSTTHGGRHTDPFARDCDLPTGRPYCPALQHPDLAAALQEARLAPGRELFSDGPR